MVSSISLGRKSIKEKLYFLEDLNIVVAAGPFTTSDNVLYEPLQDLLKFVVEKRPSVLILLGPFTEIDDKTLCTLNEPIESYFDGLVETIMETMKLAGYDFFFNLIYSN